MRGGGYDRKRSRNTTVADHTARDHRATVTDVFRRALPVLAATLLVACGGGSDPEAVPATDAPAPVVATSGAPADATTGGSTGGSTGASAAVPAALDFSAPLVGGGDIELGELAGRPVLLWFWAPW